MSTTCGGRTARKTNGAEEKQTGQALCWRPGPAAGSNDGVRCEKNGGWIFPRSLPPAPPPPSFSLDPFLLRALRCHSSPSLFASLLPSHSTLQKGRERAPKGERKRGGGRGWVGCSTSYEKVAGRRRPRRRRRRLRRWTERVGAAGPPVGMKRINTFALRLPRVQGCEILARTGPARFLLSANPYRSRSRSHTIPISSF